MQISTQFENLRKFLSTTSDVLRPFHFDNSKILTAKIDFWKFDKFSDKILKFFERKTLEAQNERNEEITRRAN